MSPETTGEWTTFHRLPQFNNLEVLRAHYITQTFARHTHNEFAIGLVEGGAASRLREGSVRACKIFRAVFTSR